jgi:hypothetical protein
MSDFTDHLLAHVRALLRQHPPFARMTRDDIDNAVLADLENNIRRDLESWIVETAAEIRTEVEMDIELEAEMKAAAKKTTRAKPRANAKTGEAT